MQGEHFFAKSTRSADMAPQPGAILSRSRVAVSRHIRCGADRYRFASGSARRIETVIPRFDDSRHLRRVSVCLLRVGHSIAERQSARALSDPLHVFRTDAVG